MENLALTLTNEKNILTDTLLFHCIIKIRDSKNNSRNNILTCISRNMLKEKTVTVANQVSSTCSKIIPEAVRSVSVQGK